MTVRIPRLNWVLRGFYGHFFQPAPILTVSGSVLNYAASLGGGQNYFSPIPSERDEEHQFGIEIPYRGWMLDVDTFKNRVNNFLDHSNLGESNMYFPIAVDGALVRAWEMTLHSPSLWQRGQFYVTYSNQIAQQRGNIIGGFTCSDPSDPACALGPQYIALDHDQRNTLNMGFTANLPSAHLVCEQRVLWIGVLERADRARTRDRTTGRICRCTRPSTRRSATPSASGGSYR